jgi:hypothetical protein
MLEDGLEGTNGKVDWGSILKGMVIVSALFCVHPVKENPKQNNENAKIEKRCFKTLIPLV